MAERGLQPELGANASRGFLGWARLRLYNAFTEHQHISAHTYFIKLGNTPKYAVYKNVTGLTALCRDLVPHAPPVPDVHDS